MGVTFAVMADVHQLILQHGVEEARRQALTKHERQVVEAAYQVLSDDAERMGFTYSGFALTSLPHKPQQAPTWRREGHNLTLVLQAGVDRIERSIGLPYGSYARFILLFLQSEAIRSGSREIALGRSMRIWLGHMGLSIGGETYRRVNEQARRISACTLMFFSDRKGSELMRRGGFVDGAITMTDALGDQPGLWQERVLLNEEFYRALRDHPVPLSESALRAIGPRSMVIDVYIWLAYRLHALKRDVEIGWPALHAQFGAGYTRLRAFRAQFLEALNLAAAVYPEANLSIGERGVILRPSRPAIAKV
jgi:Plasmid encoded RepA protein